MDSVSESNEEVASSNNIILVDQYLENATEIDVDLIRDSKGNVLPNYLKNKYDGRNGMWNEIVYKWKK